MQGRILSEVWLSVGAFGTFCPPQTDLEVRVNEICQGGTVSLLGQAVSAISSNGSVKAPAGVVPDGAERQ